MGRTAVLMVIGLSVIVGIFTLKLNSTSSDAVETSLYQYNFSMARNIAHSAVSIVLHQIQSDKTTTSFTGTFNNGTYSISKSQVGDTIWLSVTSTFADTTLSMRLKLMQYPKPFPKTNAAVGFASDSINFSMSGSPQISGQDVNTDGSPGPNPTLPAVTVPTAYDSSKVAPDSSYLTGSPKVAVSDSIPQPQAYIDEYFADATVTLPSSVSGNDTYGSATDPAIAVRDGDLSLSGGTTIYGILVVKGNLTISGSVRIYGIVINYGSNVTVDITTTTGTPKIYGGFLMSGPPKSTFTMKGNGYYTYSSQALNNVKNGSTLLAYHILDWWE
ncbi:MAG: hypothetical protein KGJ59_10795 [Bacteroidota bacterium]|nr:hypothetical protein [Bacteroidota bacterium]